MYSDFETWQLFFYILCMKLLLITIGLSLLLLAQTPDDQNLFRLAQAFEQQGEYERSLQLYSELFKKDSNDYQYFDAVRRMNIQMKRYDEAIQITYRRFKSTPYDFNLQANIGSFYAMAGKKEQADSVWNIVLLSSNKNQMIYRAVANEQTNQRLFDKAIETYRRGRKEIGDPLIFANDLGYLYSFMMDYENATREYLLLLRQNEMQFDFVQSRISSFATRTEGLKAAIKVVNEEIELHQTVPLLRLQMWLSMEDNRYGYAFTVAQKIEKLINSNGMEIFQFAERVFHEKVYAVAASAYQSALEKKLTPQLAQQSKFGYARCIEELSAAGDSIALAQQKSSATSMLETQPTFSRAIELYLSLAKEFPASNTGANSLYRIGMIRYKQLYDLDGALQMFDSVLAVSPQGPMMPVVLSAIGAINIAQGKLDDAVKRFAAINTLPFSSAEQRTSAQFSLAEIQFFKNNFDSALALLKPLTQNLKADETNDALLLQYFITENKFQFLGALKQYAHAELLARQMKASEAVNEFDAVIDIYSTAPLADDALLKKGEYLAQLHKYPEALAAYQKLLDEFTLSTEKDKTYFKIGELYQLYLNDKQKAIQSYEVILEKFPFSLLAEEARKRIRLLRGDAI